MLTAKPLTEGFTPLVDLRSAQQYQQAHPANATNIPLPELNLAWHELPPKGARLDLVVTEQQLVEAKQRFAQQQYQVDQIFIAEQSDQTNWQADNISQRLWRANPLLENYFELIGEQLVNHSSDKMIKPTALDIGCGSGRDSIFLALQGMQLHAIDNNQLALKRLAQFDRRHQTNIQTHLLDLQQLDCVAALIERVKPSLIVQARYLHRPLLELYQNKLESGAIVAIHTFLEGAAAFGKPKNPAYLLKNNELSEKFADWKVVLNKEFKLQDGRPLSLFLAQKP